MAVRRYFDEFKQNPKIKRFRSTRQAWNDLELWQRAKARAEGGGEAEGEPAAKDKGTQTAVGEDEWNEMGRNATYLDDILDLYLKTNGSAYQD